MNDRVTLCNDGKYRWAYEVNLYKNTQILRDLFLAVGISLGFVYFLLLAIEIYHGMDFDDFIQTTLVFLGIAAFLSFISIISYYIWAAISGGRYCVLFTMDEQGVTHQQMPSQVKKGQIIGAIGALSGLATGNYSQAGLSLLAVSASSFRTEFVNVRHLIPVHKRNLIKVNETLTKNRVFVPDEDNFFVLNFISQRCPQAQK